MNIVFCKAAPIIFVLLSILLCCKAKYSSKAESSFTKRFHDSCSKYPFVKQHVNLLNKPPSESDQYLIYSFAEHGLGSNGGLGDRLAGLVTAIAYASRTKRRFLIAADRAFQDVFVPYHPSSTDGSVYHWKDWAWSGWKDEYNTDISFIHGCVNPKASAKSCALDSASNKAKVVKHRGNRSYLCRWAIRPGLNIEEELKVTLGIESSTDLYEVGGCLLRLVMWPSKNMWTQVDQWMVNHGLSSPHSSSNVNPTPATNNFGTRLISIHFRCGDASFKGGGSENQCLYDTSGKRKWKGTSFADDYSLESPVDCAECARKAAMISGADKADAIIYVASDNAATAMQINNTVNWPVSLVPLKSCHVDHSTHGGAHICAVSTFVQWFVLSLSDSIVLQSLKFVEKPEYDLWHEYSDATKVREAGFAKVEPGGPISAFSRYAAIYGLKSDNMLYGISCTPANRSALSWQTRGNWMCDNKLFY
jgi:hypothetical protein